MKAYMHFQHYIIYYYKHDISELCHTLCDSYFSAKNIISALKSQGFTIHQVTRATLEEISLYD